ncbi:fungal-specific transcription factor domain-containing protein, partial [Mycotypha africana]|uniref:fungal-specific transcription factor domain-containing protein n=1 Tax=Mycotypha africana TaxID=64632 RepID=UPI00230199B4
MMNENTHFEREAPRMNYTMNPMQQQPNQQPLQPPQPQQLPLQPHAPSQRAFPAMSPPTTHTAPSATTATHNSDLAQGSSSSHGKRTRITRACDTCRRKKIKCDVDTHKPCSTCQQYNWECTFHDTAKKRGPPKGYIESLETRLEKMESLLKSLKQEQPVFPSASLSSIASTTGTPQQMTANNTITLRKKRALTATGEKQISEGKVVRYHGSSSGYYLMSNLLSNNNEKEEGRVHDEVDPPMGDKNKVYYVPSLNGGGENVRLRRLNVDDDDLMVVRDATADEEALQIADDGQEPIEQIIPGTILTALVHTFFTNAHITVPVLDKDEYLDAFYGRTTPPPAPLLTYSICAYACYLKGSDDPIFREAGIERNHAFQILLDRAIFLVRKEYLKPRVVTIQALVLLCAHPTYSTSTYRNWILAGMAVRMAQDLGLHRTLTTIEVSSEFKEKRKRLWYSCYNTDRWCCAVMGRPLAIADSDCDIDLPLTHGASGQEDFVMFVNFVKLSGILGEVLRRIYSPKAKSNGYKTKVMEQTVWSIQKMLEEWFHNVPEGYKITEADLELMKANPNIYAKDSKKLMEGGPLTICYHAVVLLLHRPFLVFDSDDSDSTEMPSLARATDLCRKTAKLSVDVARTIPIIAIAKFGWNFAGRDVWVY